MRIFKDKAFNKWARKVGISADDLRAAAREIVDGRVEADLGGKVYKKRIALGAGKSGGARTIVCYQQGRKMYFVYGFEKNERANIKKDELKAFRKYADYLCGLNDVQIQQSIEQKLLFEIMVKSDG